MADEQIRDLERQSALGDSEAQQRLIAIRNRSGLSNLHAEYFQEYLKLTDELVEACGVADKRHPWIPEEERDIEDDESFYDSYLSSMRSVFRNIERNFQNRLDILNMTFISLGLNQSTIRSKFPARDAITMDYGSAWYNSSCY